MRVPRGQDIARTAVAEREGTPLPGRVLDSVRSTRAALKGPVRTPVEGDVRSVNVRANPMALMLSGAMLLRHLGETGAGDQLEAAVAAVIAEGRMVTYDQKPTRDDPSATSTTQVRDAIVERLTSR